MAVPASRPKWLCVFPKPWAPAPNFGLECSRSMNSGRPPGKAARECRRCLSLRGLQARKLIRLPSAINSAARRHRLVTRPRARIVSVAIDRNRLRPIWSRDHNLPSGVADVYKIRLIVDLKIHFFSQNLCPSEGADKSARVTRLSSAVLALPVPSRSFLRVLNHVPAIAVLRLAQHQARGFPIADAKTCALGRRLFWLAVLGFVRSKTHFH